MPIQWSKPAFFGVSRETFKATPKGLLELFANTEIAENGV
jgi:hypothetical protein